MSAMFRPFPVLAAALLTVAVPVAALADKPAHAGKNGKGHAKIERKIKHQAQRSVSPRRAAEREARLGGTVPVVVGGSNPVVVAPARVVQNCPPGLAKKDPPCVPPGQAKKGHVVGTAVDWDDVHVITRPGLYGLSEPPKGQRYAIVDGRLVRVDRESSKILSIIRLVDAILD